MTDVSTRHRNPLGEFAEEEHGDQSETLGEARTRCLVELAEIATTEADAWNNDPDECSPEELKAASDAWHRVARGAVSEAERVAAINEADKWNYWADERGNYAEDEFPPSIHFDDAYDDESYDPDPDTGGDLW